MEIVKRNQFKHSEFNLLEILLQLSNMTVELLLILLISYSVCTLAKEERTNAEEKSRVYKDFVKHC